MAGAAEAGAVPDDDLQLHCVVAANVEPVEALWFGIAQARGGGGARLDHERAAAMRHHLLRGFGIGAVEVAGQRDMDTGLADGSHGILMPPDGFAQFAALADGHGEQRMMGDQDASLVRRYRREAVAKHVHLVMIDPPVLDRQRPRGVDAQDRDFGILVEGTEIMADIAAIAAQRRHEAAHDIVERHVMIARHDQRLEPRGVQATKPGGGLAELVDASALGEVAADDHQVGLALLQPGGGGVDDLGIVRAEMDVGQVSDTGHG